MTALRFPKHFPPTDKWKKFFIGLRWLGPDLSFFKTLKAEQEQRDTYAMNAWGGGKRQEIAISISRVLAQQLGWKSEYFLPDDSAMVAFHGPRFDFLDQESAYEAVLETLKADFEISPSSSFWQSHTESTMGELIDSLLGQH